MHSVDQTKISEHIRLELSHFQDLKRLGGAKEVWQWSGELDSHDLHAITQDLEQLLNEVGASKQCVKRTFSILIEGLQNNLLHSLKSGDQPMYGLGIAFINDQVDMIILSLSDDEHVQKVCELVKDLNKLNTEDIKSHYRMTMNNGQISEKGGAGLGLITMVMKSKDGMHVEASKVTEDIQVLSCFLSVS